MGSGHSQERKRQRGQATDRALLSGRDSSDVHSLGSAGGHQMIAADTRVYRLGEFHPFSARNRRFLYLVPAGAIFELDGAAEMLIDRLAEGEASEEQIVADLAGRGFPAADAQELIS